MQGQLIEQLHVLGTDLPGQRQHTLLITQTVIGCLRHHLGHRHALQRRNQFGQHPGKVRALLCQLGYCRHQGSRVTSDQRFQHRKHLAVVDGAEHVAYFGHLQLAVAKGNSLVGQAQGIAHRAIGSTPQKPQRLLIKTDLLIGQNMLQVLNHLFRRHILQGKLQATRKNGDRQFLRIGRSQQKLDVLRRLFKGFQQRVETVAGEHVHFVDQVDLEAPTGRRVLHVLQQLAGVFNLGATGSVDLDQVNEATLVNFQTG